MTARPSSWLNEIGQKPARRPSVCASSTVPFEIPQDAVRRNQRSLSDSLGQNPARLSFVLHNDFEKLSVINDSMSDSDGDLGGIDYSLHITQSAGDPRQHFNAFAKGAALSLWTSGPPHRNPNMSRLAFEHCGPGPLGFDDMGSLRRKELSRPSTADEYNNVYKSGWYPNGVALQTSLSHETQESPLLNSRMDAGYSSNPLNYPSPIQRGHLSPPEVHYCVVEFKCFRAEVYQIYPNQFDEFKRATRQGHDLVIVEADRGSDLGVARLLVPSLLAARALKRELDQKQIRHLLGFSMAATSHALGDPASFNMDVGEYIASPVMAQARPGKYIKRIASDAEASRLIEKKEAEEHAKDLCQKKVEEHGLVMEILEAEYQSDYKKLTFYYYAPNVIQFSPLVTDLFKIYKTRIWMSPINKQAVPKSPIAVPQSPPHPFALFVGKRPQGMVRPRSQSQWSALSPTSPSFMSSGSYGWPAPGSLGFNGYHNGGQPQEASR